MLVDARAGAKTGAGAGTHILGAGAGAEIVGVGASTGCCTVAQDFGGMMGDGRKPAHLATFATAFSGGGTMVSNDTGGVDGA